ncbi:iron-containing redox enzyme family protein [Marinobacterium sp. AK62]|uniref:Iron-containing redox enzyme family protein n=1 Tax=Marinobacterium alkalitolerans TaxID=1542925 RepID=A0ABS3Z7K2_9GAMM|nr:iron-containing redox enzyme family protein [Marinobacterium alkalitolerans]MBP0047694.1 iron-containing redox enzyme family protein [Marinobacterium alkalitolerans]
MPFYDQLQQDTVEARRHLREAPIILACQQGEISLNQYTAFLTEAYHHVKHTLPLLMACGSRLPERLEWLREAVAEYIEEETGHQEWILNDLAACGIDKESVRHGQPSMATELMVAYAYDLIHRVNPVGFFGMVQVLEGTSVDLATPLAEIIQQRLELPDAAFSYLRSHGSLDQDHIQFFRSLMGRIESPEEQALITHSARVFYRLYGDIFRSLPTA